MSKLPHRSKTLSALCAIIVSAGIAISAVAQDFESPTWFGEANTEYAEWLNFTTAVGENSPDVEGSTDDAVLSQSTQSAFVTGSGNIYNPAGTSVFEVHDSTDDTFGDVVFQTKTSGTELDYETLVLEYNDGEIQALAATREELLRESGAQGDTVVSQWSWDLADLKMQEFVIRFSSLGAHNSFVAARLDTQIEPGGQVFEIVKTRPDLDRWNYPYNATPGTRTTAPVYQAEYETHIDRYGNYVLGFETSENVTSGGPREAYIIESARLIATTTSNFEVAYDPTYDSVFTFLPEDHEQYVSDEDTGRPIELFGAGFQNGFDALTWEETTEFSSGEDRPNVFPASVNESGGIVDVTEAVNFETPVESLPFAIGTFDFVTPGNLVPYDTAMTFELNVNDPAVQTYLQTSLSTGRLFFTITGLPEGVMGATTRTYPEFATRDNLLSNPPSLEMTVRVIEVASTLDIASLQMTEKNEVMIFFSGEPDGDYRVRYTSDFATWQVVENPTLNFPESGVVQWLDENPDGQARFYQILSE